MFDYKTNLITSKLLIFALLSFFSLNLFADRETFLEAWAELNTESMTADFNWVLFAEGDEAIEFNFYYADADKPNKIDIDQLVLISNVSEDDVESEDEETGLGEEMSFYRYNLDIEVDDYQRKFFFVEAVLENGDAVLSNPIRFEKNNWNRKQIKIESNPSQIAYLEKEYQYQVEIDFDGEVEYSLEWEMFTIPELQMDQNATIDEVTGLFSWTPSEIGNYLFSIMITDKEDPNNYNVQQFVVAVTDCEERTGINITLIDQNGNEAEGGVYLIRENDEEQDEVYYGFNSREKFVEGSAEFDLFPGEYKIAYYNNEFSMWYDNAPTQRDAETVTVECGDFNELVFNVRTDIDYERQNSIWFKNASNAAGRQFDVQIDTEFELDIIAFYMNDNGVIDEDKTFVYALEYGSELADIDPVTGKFTFTPDRAGEYSFAVRASLEEDNFVFNTYHFYVSVSECEVQATIFGQVSGTNNKMLKHAFVQAFRMYEDENGAVIGDFDKHYMAEVVDGEYELQVDAGSYILFIETELGHKVFGDGHDWEDAELVEVDCEETFEANFEFELPEESVITISGNVYDANGNAVMSQIYVEGSNKNGMGRNNWATFSTSTNQDGSYEIEVPTDMKVIVYAIPFQYNSYPLFWENTYNRNEATILNTDEDLEGITFVFNEVSNETIAISGTLKSENGDVVESGLILALQGDGLTASGNAGFGYTVLVSNGSFETAIPAGEYTFFAFAEDPNLVPGFYVEGNVATMDWELSTLVNINSDWDSSIDITLEELEPVTGGIARITGEVMEMGSNRNLSDANIYLENSQGNKIMYDKSGIDGDFGMRNLPIGSYKVVVSKMGYQTFETNVNLEDANPIDIDIPLQPLGVSSVEDQIIDNSTISPNPASELIKFTTNESLNNSEVSIYNSAGNVMVTKTVNGFEHEFNLNSYPVGTYYLQIDGSNSVIKFIVRR